MTINTNQCLPHALNFYKDIIAHLIDSGVPFLIGGGFAGFHYTGIYRETKDLDIYCKPSDYPSLLKHFAALGYNTELTDLRWLAKVFGNDGVFIDIIFDTVNNIGKVDDKWFDEAVETTLFDHTIKIISAEELVRGKLYVQNRERYDGADINHIFLRHGENINWKRLLEFVEPHWHLLLMQFLSFQFVYPYDYQYILPKEIFDELLRRASEQYELPQQVVRVCRGPLIDQTQYAIDIKEWDYKTFTITTV